MSSSIFSQSLSTKRLLFWLIVKAFVLTVVIFYAGIGLGPDEAQYWTWSQALDWGYYSKPPGIAWQIWLGTQLFGQTEWGVRSLSILCAILQAWSLYRLALQAGIYPYTAFWCGLMMAFCPLGILGSFLAITDVGFLLCWTVACLILVSALQQKREPHPLFIGAAILVGALFKWPMYIFWLFFLLCRHWYFPQQTKTSVLAGLLLSLCGLLPSLWWNWSHDWATFRHVFATMQGGSGHQAVGNIGEFLGAQALLLFPLLFVLLLCALWQWFRQRKSLTPPLFFCGFVTLASLGIATFLSCFQKMQGNWAIFAYPTGLLVLGWDAFQEHPQRAWWAKVGLGVSIILCCFAFLLPSYGVNLFKHNMGWTKLSQALVRQGYDPNQHFLFSDTYQTTSILSFYAPSQKRAYFLNLSGIRNNQFSYWPSLQEEQQEQTGYFVWIENSPYLEREWKAKLNFYQNALQHYFEKVEFLEFAPLIEIDHTPRKAAFIFRCQHCKNLPTPRSSLF